ncbi:MAG: cell wall-active antibiotics response protein [bacterium]|nr:cell wall-active antibiotics response protein [bacterium]
MKNQIIIAILLVFVLVLIFLPATVPASEEKKFEKAYSVKTDKRLLITLNIDAAKVSVQKNDKSDQVAISISYDPELDEIDIDFDDRNNELFLNLDRDKWFRSVDNHRATELKLSLPADAIIELDCKIKAGESEFNLGSLKIREFRLRNFAGEVKVDFAQQNNIEMELLDINVKVGETTLNRLGNARFQYANINGGIGEMVIDFSGDGLKSCKADIDLDIGETKVFLPENLGVRFESSDFGFLTQSNLDEKFRRKGRYFYSDNFDSATNSLEFSISSGIGELRVIYR